MKGLWTTLIPHFLHLPVSVFPQYLTQNMTQQKLTFKWCTDEIWSWNQLERLRLHNLMRQMKNRIKKIIESWTWWHPHAYSWTAQVTSTASTSVGERSLKLEVLFLHIQVFQFPHRDGEPKTGDVLGEEGQGFSVCMCIYLLFTCVYIYCVHVCKTLWGNICCDIGLYK